MTPAPGVTVRGLLNSRPDALGLSIELLAGAAGLDRRITNPHCQKTGLALAGFQEYLRPGRVLIFGESVSSVTIKQRIRKIIENEDPRKPLSDSKIVSILQREGLVLARRTIAKYREELKISTSNQRKVLY